MHPAQWVARGTVVLLVVSLVLGGTAAGMGAVSNQAVESEAFQPDEPTPGNETTRHEDPRAVDDGGDLLAVRDWLAGRMALKLEDCVIAVGAATVDVCAFEDDYPGWLRKYVDVADDTDDETDDRLGKVFDDATEESDDYARSVASFRETYREYQRAQDAGNEQRARVLARDLQRQGGAVDGTGENLVATFKTLEDGADVDLSDARISVNETRANVTAIVEEVEREQFVATELTADLAPRTVSFLQPGTVSGRLTTEDGAPVADEPIRLVVGERVLETRTDATGAFTLTYRPTLIDRSAMSLVVRYRPEDTSAYLASETVVPVTIEPVTPAVDIQVEPGTVQFDDDVTVSGRVAADGVGAPGVPVVVTLDGRQLGRVQTDGNGTFSLTSSIAAIDGPGEVTVTARYPLEGRALEPANGSAALTVERTATDLELNASADGPRTVEVSGTLQAEGGVVVPGQRVEVHVNETPVESFRTERDGGFAGAVTVPSSLLDDAGSTVRIVAVFEGTGTNLDPSNASVVVSLPPADDGTGTIGSGLENVIDRIGELANEPVTRVPGSPPLGWVVAGALLVGLGVVAYVLWRRLRRTPGGVAGASDDGDEAGSPVSPAADEPPTSPLDVARERMNADPDGAVMAAYAAVRESLPGIGRHADTHWEFLAASRADGLDEAAIEELTQLTEVFERAAYAPTGVTAGDAEEALDSAAEFVG